MSAQRDSHSFDQPIITKESQLCLILCQKQTNTGTRANGKWLRNLRKRNFKIRYGVFQQRKPSQISTENLFKPSQRKEFRGQILADICERVGITVTQNAETYSDRVCSPSRRKIRNLGALFDSLRTADTSPRESNWHVLSFYRSGWMTVISRIKFRQYKWLFVFFPHGLTQTRPFASWTLRSLWLKAESWHVITCVLSRVSDTITQLRYSVLRATSKYGAWERLSQKPGWICVSWGAIRRFPVGNLSKCTKFTALCFIRSTRGRRNLIMGLQLKII